MNAAQTFLLADTWMHGGWGWGWMSLMMIPMMLFWAAIVFGVVWLIRSTTQDRPAPSQGHSAKETPVEVLERRFAEGALTEQDYRARRTVLVNGTATSTGAHEDEPVATSQGAEGRTR